MGLTWEEVEAAALNRYESRSGSINCSSRGDDDDDDDDDDDVQS